MEMSGQVHSPAALSPEKGHIYSLDGGWVGPQSRSGRCGEEKNSQPLTVIELRSSSS